MNKKVRITILMVTSFVILFLIASYFGIMVVNNSIANRVEKELKSYPLPEQTVFLDSVSIAGKLVGNGNGMQYMGSILVVSDRSEEELYEYYSQSFDYVEVRKQESQKIHFINSVDYSFELFADPNHHMHYSITCWGSPKDIGLGESAAVVLNLDLRGH